MIYFGSAIHNIKLIEGARELQLRRARNETSTGTTTRVHSWALTPVGPMPVCHVITSASVWSKGSCAHGALRQRLRLVSTAVSGGAVDISGCLVTLSARLAP